MYIVYQNYANMYYTGMVFLYCIIRNKAMTLTSVYEKPYKSYIYLYYELQCVPHDMSHFRRK